MNDLIYNIERLHTTEMGADRIRRNLASDCDNVMELCKTVILNKEASIKRMGKNWYVTLENITLTVNAGSYTVITAHLNKEN